MNNVDFDRSEPQVMPIILSILATIVFIIGLIIYLVYFFKASLSTQEMINESKYGNAYELEEIKEWETDYLNKTEPDEKVSIDEAIELIKLNYSR